MFHALVSLWNLSHIEYLDFVEVTTHHCFTTHCTALSSLHYTFEALNLLNSTLSIIHRIHFTYQPASPPIRKAFAMPGGGWMTRAATSVSPPKTEQGEEVRLYNADNDNDEVFPLQAARRYLNNSELPIIGHKHGPEYEFASFVTNITELKNGREGLKNIHQTPDSSAQETSYSIQPSIALLNLSSGSMTRGDYYFNRVSMLSRARHSATQPTCLCIVYTNMIFFRKGIWHTLNKYGRGPRHYLACYITLSSGLLERFAQVSSFLTTVSDPPLSSRKEGRENRQSCSYVILGPLSEVRMKGTPG
ncbi:uncharacterized protein BDR25DRAFT_356087 [Lindgomyces ingoldianus]|uniref:Uncharacterized protein n=1 Tax=Lindgomyces ingoldianus TaxID=673940 RepID=A0ACB6QS81_9PLEO|nr:uncharacterized protein BDR25DRAFT_356087 [Lindgomyces ingoldianus]KAF2469844.1 hypothetical protein BDR25DRAFT_356087 [Lindgomyces ingoldianus]